MTFQSHAHRTVALAEPSGPGPSNALLDRFGPAAAGLVAAGRRVRYALGEPIWSEGDPVNHVLFVLQGLVTLQWTDADGATAEVDAVGPEGAVGLTEALGGAVFAFDARAELPTECLLVPADVLRDLIKADHAVADLCWTYALQVQTRTRRGVGCASRHAARVRLADYLLAVDAASADRRLGITQEMLAAALGVYRTTVTALLAQFADEHLVRSGRGWLTITDRIGLQRVACGCRSRPESGFQSKQCDRHGPAA